MKMCKCMLLVLFVVSATLLFPGEGKKSMDISLIEEHVKIDGKLDESFYKDLVPVEDFYQYHPKNGAKPTFKTQVYGFYDKNNVYFGFKCFDDTPEKIVGDVAPFGGYFSNDEVKIYIDTYLDKRTYKTFAVNPRGILKGEQTVWNASAEVTDFGWTAEFKIPFKSLRFPVRDIQHWTINFERFIFRLNETEYWTNVTRDQQSIFGDTFGKLEGIKDVKAGKNVEIYPYAGYRSSRSGDVKDDKFAYGLDLKYGITSNLTLDFTSSPDYSEVESDPFFYQLSAYEVVLQENRPFYYESSSYFDTPFQLFYSRRITDPVLAAKVTGKEKGFSVGALFAKNNREGAPDVYHGVFRLKKDIFKISHIGMIYSSIEEKGNYNRNIGVDFDFTFKDIYFLTGMAAFSFNKGVSNSQNGMYALNFARLVDKGLSFAIRYKRWEPNVYVPAGYIKLVDVHNGSLIGIYSFRWEGKWLEKFSIQGATYLEGAIDGRFKTEGTALLGLEFLTRSRFRLNCYYRHGQMKHQIISDQGTLVWDDELHTANIFYATLDYFGSSVVEFGLNLNLFDAYVYNASYTDTKKGKLTEYGLYANFKISPQLQFSASYYKTQYHSDDRTIDFKGDLISSRLNYQISKRLATFVRFQYDSSLERFQYDFVIGYEPANVSKIIFSLKNYSENRFMLFDPDGRSIAFKVSYLYRF